ncbi:MAG: glycoside hydrolase family 3 C-terminal domain-containing protein [Lachnospiraceae bacterium]|nr:glycoside hydrolase family 3 C-terminal domain-containing protein [Lachnospiraceae bacterium]
MDRESAKKKAEALVNMMTIEERASQLRYDSPAIERLSIPAYNWWNEALHGVARAGQATVFPQAIAMAATFDEDTVKNAGEIVSTEARAKYNALSEEGDRDIYKGLTMWSPNINIFRDPRWGRGHETLGEDPYLTSRLGAAYVKGLQGEGATLRTAACAKHFAVHSGPEALRHEFDAVVSKKDMHETYLPAFETLVKEAKVEAVMGAYNRTNGEPCCAHSVLMEDILRGEWGFEGHYVSDCWAVRDFHEHHMVTATVEESAALALKKGCDVNCGNTYIHMMKAYEDGLVSEEDITKACVRLYTTRFMLGLFDSSEYDSIPYEKIECNEHREFATEVARKAMVLLKNDEFLPINKGELHTIGVIGPDADSRVALIGNYHGTSSRYKTILEGIQDEAGTGVRVLYSQGSHLYKDRVEPLAMKGDRLAEAKVVAEHSEVVILVLGLDETLEGEEGDTGNSYASGDKTDLSFPESQMELARTVIATGKPVVLAVMTGSAMDLSFARDASNVKAIIQVWYPGAEGGRAFADILFGRRSPSGKLPITLYESLSELPDFTDYSMKGRTYRYMENKAQYPFGFGLTYGKVSIKSAEFDIAALKAAAGKDTAGFEDSSADMTVTIKNESARPIEEVIQVYIKDNGSALAVKNHSLCAFKRVALSAGEEKQVTLPVSGRAFMEYDEEGRRVLDSSDFTLFAGVSQPDELSVKLSGVKPAVVDVKL